MVGMSPTARTRQASGPEAAGQLANARRIVLAEDDPELRRLVADKLRRAGYDVVELSSGERLAEYLFAEGGISEVDLVLTDIRMPGLSGMDMLAYMSARGDAPRVILVTAFGDWQVHEEARRLGALAVFDKPLDLDSLANFLRGTLPPEVV